MKPFILIAIAAVTLSACGEHQGRKTNCWSSSFAAGASASVSGGGCDFEALPSVDEYWAAAK